jgi:hypothetical protein
MVTTSAHPVTFSSASECVITWSDVVAIHSHFDTPVAVVAPKMVCPVAIRPSRSWSVTFTSTTMATTSLSNDKKSDKKYKPKHFLDVHFFEKEKNIKFI